MNASTNAALEAARQADGRFGTQPLDEATGVVLGNEAATDGAALPQATLLDVSRALSESRVGQSDDGADWAASADSAREQIRAALAESSVGAADLDATVEAVHARLFTDAFTDEDGDHGPQGWSALDADDRYAGQFTTYVAMRDSVRIGADQGDASSYANDGFSWRAEQGSWFFSGQTATLAEAQQAAASTADYITSGRAEADAIYGLDDEGFFEH